MEDDKIDRDDGWNDPMICRSLWLSVIAQAMGDAKSQSGKPEARKARREALAWFAQRGLNSDFVQTCDLAGVSPEKVRQVLKQVRRGKTRVDFRCLRKPKLINRLIRGKKSSTPNQGANHGNS